jgi:hypothetical protein
LGFEPDAEGLRATGLLLDLTTVSGASVLEAFLMVPGLLLDLESDPMENLTSDVLLPLGPTLALLAVLSDLEKEPEQSVEVLRGGAPKLLALLSDLELA